MTVGHESSGTNGTGRGVDYGVAAGGRAMSAPIMGSAAEPTLFELSQPGRHSWQLRTTGMPEWSAGELVPSEFGREAPIPLAEVSERDLVGHFTRLSHRQFSVDLGAYPLGSCTMKYNPKLCDTVAGLPGLAGVHPGAPASLSQGWLEIYVELEEALCEVTGMAAATLQPAAGAAGELTGLLLMRAYHQARGESRHRVIIPDSAHGTNPASVTLGGYETVTVPSDERGCVDLAALRAVLDTDVAGIMLTNPNTLGLFEEDIEAIAAAVHEVGGLLYYDGANLNAILGVVRPGDMGFDIVHMNLHKTFATPHGGGGPGAGPVAVSARLTEFLPGPRPVRLGIADDADGDGDAGAGDGDAGGDRKGALAYGYLTPSQSIGRVHSWHGNALVLARALAYMEVHGGDGLRRVAERAVLNANWIRQRLSGSYDVPFDRPCMHEVVLSAATLRKRYGTKALDVGKRLLEFGFHSPTVYFPLIVDEALMIEPTETESLQTLEALAEALDTIAAEAAAGEPLSEAPRTTPVRRVDEARAARTLIPTFDARP
jgi:glycine dehydrogenase subunit 2